MKVLLVVVALLIAIEAQGWQFNGPGVGNGRGNNPGRGPWASQQQQSQNNILVSDVEWMCQNPKTNDIVILHLRAKISYLSIKLLIFFLYKYILAFS